MPSRSLHCNGGVKGVGGGPRDHGLPFHAGADPGEAALPRHEATGFERVRVRRVQVVGGNLGGKPLLAISRLGYLLLEDAPAPRLK